MMRFKRTGVFILAAVTISCGDPMQPEASLPGTWSTGRPDDRSSGRWEVELDLSPDGQFRQRTTRWGIYPFTDERVYESIIEGTFSVDGRSLLFTPTTYEWWDSFYEDPGPHPGDPPAVLYAHCTFEVQFGRLLVLRYTTYPADAPVRTVRSFVRIQ